MERCGWADGDPLMRQYHDEEWGVPLHDDRKLFEFLVLEGAQAGLSWLAILRKRENYRAAFHGFRPERIARYAERDVARLLADPGIVRNRLKIRASIENARRFLDVRREFGTFDAYIWRFVGGRPVPHRFHLLRELPATSEAAEAMSADLRRRGFRFAGATICYAFMQAVGMVNDHLVGCFRHDAVTAIGGRSR
ncbi:MAG: DNA-3-methyladenine glycosylase I [Deltaproteobacteria bacterium]|nr:DNA-3-methyladenine glycosylase I [Deltaproteobacteria bacterium]